MESSEAGVASSTGVGAVSSNARLVIDVGTEGRRSRRKRKVRVVVISDRDNAVRGSGWEFAEVGPVTAAKVATGYPRAQ